MSCAHISTDGHQQGPHSSSFAPPSRRKPCSHQLKPSKRKPGITQGTKSRTVSEPSTRFLFYVLGPPRGQIIFNSQIIITNIYPPLLLPFLQPFPPPDFSIISLTPVRTEHGHRRRSPPIPTHLHRQATHSGRQQTHLRLNLHPPATDVHHTSPASGTSTFHSLSSPFPIRLSP